MKNTFGAAIALAILVAAPARAAINDDVHECKFVHTQDGIDACNRLLTHGWSEDQLSWVYFNRGSDYLFLRQYQQALPDLNEAIKVSPEYSDAFLNRAMAYTHLGQLQLAKADLDTVVAFHADYLQSSGSNPRANHYLATPMDSARMQRAQLEILMGDIDDAVTDADTARMRAPNNAVANSTACWVHAIKGDQLDTALADCNAAIDMTPDDASFLFRRGFVRYRMNDFPGAIKDFDQSLATQPKDATALYVRGLAKAKSGDAAASKADMDAAIAMTPKVAELFTRYGIGL
jgi:tetratricopeptide (TPR) repeat protein